MSSIGGGREGGGVRGVSTFWDPPSRILLGHFFKIINIYLESSAQELSIGTLFQVSGGTVEELPYWSRPADTAPGDPPEPPTAVSRRSHGGRTRRRRNRQSI